MERRGKFRLTVLAAIVLAVFLYTIPDRPEICDYSNKTNHEECAAYHVLPFLFIEIFKFLNDYGSALGAIATIAIAGFTYTLWQSTEKLWVAGEKQRKSSELIAKSASALSERIGEAQVRAYVSIQKAAVEIGIADTCPSFVFCAFNSGQSPALNFRWSVSVQYVSPDDIQKSGFFKWHEYVGFGIPARETGLLESASIPNLRIAINEGKAFNQGEILNR